MKKKLVAFILILIFIINTTIPNSSYAYTFTGTYQDAQDHQAEGKDQTVKEVWEEEKATVTPSGSSARSEELKEGQNSSSVVAGVLGSVFATLPLTLNSILTLIINVSQPSNNSNYPKIGSGDRFLIEDLVMGKYYLFDIDITNYKTDSNNITDILKKNVAKWYFSLRNLAIVANLILLIYIGIRMMISTVAEDQAKYKKMFTNWLISFLLIFGIHYIFILLFQVQKILIELISMLTQGEGFEEELLNNSWDLFSNAKGWNGVIYVIEIYIFVYYQLKFFYLYFKRVLSVDFLFIISPIITVADAIYSASSSVPIYRKWFREITFNIFIQVIHAVVYAIFILSAASIAKAVPILGALLLMTLSRTEKIIKSTFRVKGPKNLGDMKFLDIIKQRKGLKRHN